VEDSNLAASVFQTAVPPLLPLNRDVHDVALAVHEQEGEVGRFEGIGEALQDRKTVYMLAVQFQHDIIRLQADCFGQPGSSVS
jgi:hypothetical protein